MFRVGLNPYGLAYAVGLQGAGTPRANPEPIGLSGFIALAREIGAKCVELDDRWLRPMTPTQLAQLRDELVALGASPIVSATLSQQRGETLEDTIRCATAIGASILRLGLTPVLEGARARWGARWSEMVAHAASLLAREAPRAAAAGVVLAIEDHQDLGSEELVALADAAGPDVGIVLDTGNPLAVGEDPVAFARRVAPRVRHVHLKDYRAQFTEEGYRLVRCAIGDGCVPIDEIVAGLARHHRSLTASLEPGALEARHIRLCTPDWWLGYPPREASELGTAIGRLWRRRLADDEDYRTPWEHGVTGPELVAYEMDQIRRSVDNLARVLRPEGS